MKSVITAVILAAVTATSAVAEANVNLTGFDHEFATSAYGHITQATNTGRRGPSADTLEIKNNNTRLVTAEVLDYSVEVDPLVFDAATGFSPVTTTTTTTVAQAAMYGLDYDALILSINQDLLLDDSVSEAYQNINDNKTGHLIRDAFVQVNRDYADLVADVNTFNELDSSSAWTDVDNQATATMNAISLANLNIMLLGEVVLDLETQRDAALAAGN